MNRRVQFFELAERFRDAADPTEARELGEQLGRLVFPRTLPHAEVVRLRSTVAEETGTLETTILRFAELLLDIAESRATAASKRAEAGPE